MAAYGAAKTAADAGVPVLVTVLEKMPRPARKIMITGKGRCNFTNVKSWNDFSSHVRSNPNFVKNAFYNLNPDKVLDFFEQYGMPTVVERGDRAFPASHRASDVVDALTHACKSYGAKIETECEVCGVTRKEGSFELTTADGGKWLCAELIIATGGLSYPLTGSTGDGLTWASGLGHSIKPTFPSLTALVPQGYKSADAMPVPSMKGHIDRSTPLSEQGRALCGISLKNVGVRLKVEGITAQEEFGDIDFTDGGLEGPLGFQISRKAVKSLLNGSRVCVEIDLKNGVPLQELFERIKTLWMEVDRDPRSARLHEKEKCRILLGKLMPWELIPAFKAANPQIMTLERRGRRDSKLWVNLSKIAEALKCWRFDIEGFVGYERAVVTAGGVSGEEILPKTMESRLCRDLFLCGEVLDIDSDTGGYNLQTAFCTGYLAGQSATKKLIQK